MKRSYDNDDEAGSSEGEYSSYYSGSEMPTRAQKAARRAHPKWVHQSWEDAPFQNEANNSHFVTLAVRRSGQDGYGDLNGRAAYGQIIFAASAFARIRLITTQSHSSSASTAARKPHDGIGIYFDEPINMNILAANDMCMQLTIDQTVITVGEDKHARLEKWNCTNRAGNMVYKDCLRKDGTPIDDMRSWTINSVEISSLDSYTSDLYAALMHQYIDKKRMRVCSDRAPREVADETHSQCSNE
jgi:hypothetical protein